LLFEGWNRPLRRQLRIFRRACRERFSCSDSPMKAHKLVRKSKGAIDMKYILMMHCPQTGYDSFGAWPKKDIEAHIAFMLGINKTLRESGELAGAEGLADPKRATLVRAGKDGSPMTDGVFPESKEFLAGYWIVNVQNPEQAYKIAARASAAPGPGGAPMNMPIEVRQVMSGPPEEFQ
jgi:hypothetical protein